MAEEGSRVKAFQDTNHHYLFVSLQLVPVQYVLGFSMLFLSTRVNSYLDSDGQPNIQMLTLVFFILNFLAATQDIAVDGWALTMLHRLLKNLWQR